MALIYLASICPTHKRPPLTFKDKHEPPIVFKRKRGTISPFRFRINTIQLIQIF